MHRCEPAGAPREYVGVGIEERDLGPGRRRGLLEEVARARTDVQVPTPEVLAVVLHAGWDRDLPDRARHEPEHPRVVDREHEPVVAAVALVSGIGLIHLAHRR
jgi:hypothetical protein